MNHTQGYCMILVACPDMKAADELAAEMVERRLAACVQITAITSYYQWKGSMNRDAEQLLLIKTRAVLYPEIESFIKDRHSYEVPEIIMVPVHKGLPAYLNWIDEVTG